MPIGLSTYNQTDMRESLLKVLKDVSPNTDNYFVSNLAVAPSATQPLHQWGVYNTARPTSTSSVAEGADAVFADLSTPTKSSNATAIVSEPVKVTGTSKAVSTITGEDPVAFQKGRALLRLKAKMEFNTVNGAFVSGSSGVARVNAGIDALITTNVTARASGTSFTETELNDIMQDSWNAVGMEYVANTIVCPMVISRRISGFTSNLTRFINATDKRLSAQIRVYDSQVGQTVNIVPHKDVRAAAGTLTVLAVNDSLFAHSFLAGREPAYQELAKNGDYEVGQYITEFTVVSFAEKASAKRTGYSTSL